MRPVQSSSTFLSFTAGDPPYSMEEAQPFILNDDDQHILDLCEEIKQRLANIMNKLEACSENLTALSVARQVPSQLDEDLSDCDSNRLFVNEFPALLVSSPSSAPSTTGDPPYPNQASTPMPFMANDVIDLDEFGQPWMDTTVHPLNPTNLWLFYKEHYATCCHCPVC